MFEEGGSLLQSEHTCVVYQGNEIVYKGCGKGVKPLLYLYQTQPQILRGGIVADKVIGKAAAVILVLGGAAGAYGEVMSKQGRNYLLRHGIEAGFGELVPFIENRTQTGMCPLEETVLGIEDPVQGLAMLKDKIAQLMAEKQ